jgi:tRNA pseudouridine38-40 synthase
VKQAKRKRLLGTLAFVGTGYQGWQTQKQGGSIEEHVAAVFAQILQHPIKLYGASRTDAGVHARGFVFHVDVTTSMPIQKLRHHLNRLLDEAIYLVKLTRVSDTFEARYQHTKKTYTYTVLCEDRDPFLKDTALFIPHLLDATKLRPVLALFCGQHNFRNFTTKKIDGGHFIRTIFTLTLKQTKKRFVFTFVGDGFMTYMIRMIVGTFLAYQQDKITLDEIKDYLSGHKKGPVSYKAPPHGLCLEKVQYESKT